MTSTVHHPTLAQLMTELERMPANRTVALQVLRLADPDTGSTRELGDAVMGDPALATRLLRTANSAYYGLRGRVSSLSQAIVVVGMSTVRSLAAVAAAGLTDSVDAVPPGFWRRSALTAVAASAVAPRYRGNRSESFSTGLLHDLGSALFHRADPVAFAAVQEAAGEPDADRAALEVAAFGMDHATAGGTVLLRWNLPRQMCDTIIGHHHRPPAPEPLPQTLAAAQLIVAHLIDDPATLHRDPVDELISLGVEPDLLERLVAQVERDAEPLAAALSADVSAEV